MQRPVSQGNGLSSKSSTKVTDFFVTAIIRSAHGIRGECKVSSVSGDYELLKHLKTARISLNGFERPIEIEYVRGAVPNVLLKIKGLDTPEQVNQLRGAEILRSREDGPALGADEYYTSDLVDCSLLYQDQRVATIVSVWESAAHSMLEVEKTDGTRVHIPFLNKFIGTVSVVDRTVELLVDWILD